MNPLFKRVAGWFLVFLALAFVVSIYDSQVLAKHHRFKWGEKHWKIRGDFTSYSLAASRTMAKGENPYDKANQDDHPYKYFPLNAFLLTPFTWVPIPVAQGFWFSLNVLLILAALRAHQPLLGRKKVPVFVWVIALAIGGRFIWDNLQLGQWNLPVYSLTILGLSLIIGSGKNWRGGFLLSLGAALKFMPAIFLFYFLMKRNYRAVAAILVGLVFWIYLLPTAIIGPERHHLLLGDYMQESRIRSEKMVGSDEVSGHSLLVTVRAYLTPCHKNSGHHIEGDIHILNLPPQTAMRIAQTLCGILALWVFCLCLKGGAGTPAGQRTLLDICLLLTLILLISPEARKAQFLTVFSTAFTLATYLKTGNLLRGESRIAAISLFCGLILVIFSSSSIGRDTNHAFLLHGGLTFLLFIFLFALSILKWRKTGEPGRMEAS